MQVLGLYNASPEPPSAAAAASTPLNARHDTTYRPARRVLSSARTSHIAHPRPNRCTLLRCRSGAGSDSTTSASTPGCLCFAPSLGLLRLFSCNITRRNAVDESEHGTTKPARQIISGYQHPQSLTSPVLPSNSFHPTSTPSLVLHDSTQPTRRETQTQTQTQQGIAGRSSDLSLSSPSQQSLHNTFDETTETTSRTACTPATRQLSDDPTPNPSTLSFDRTDAT